MKQIRITSEHFVDKRPEIDDAVLSSDDPIHELRHLAGLPPARNVYEDQQASSNPSGHMSPLGSNISVTAAEKHRLEREHNIKPGTDEWFKLWFSRPYLTGEKPIKGK